MKFRVGRIVYLAFSRDETRDGLRLPQGVSATPWSQSEPEKFHAAARIRTCASTGSSSGSPRIDAEEMRGTRDRRLGDPWSRHASPPHTRRATAASAPASFARTGFPRRGSNRPSTASSRQGDGWFVLNARDARWRHADGRSAICDFEGDQDFSQLGINLSVLEPGEPMAMYHWEADQEDFLVLAGEALLIVEGEERPLRQWDFVHCPPGTKHMIVGAGDAPCVVLAVGARDARSTTRTGAATPWTRSALRHGASVEEPTTSRGGVRAVPPTRADRYRDGWLPNE